MIKRIAVENFRTLRDVKLDLGLRNVLVGPNMSGKSNLIDLFRFIWNMVVTVPGISGLGNAFNLRNGFYEVAWKGSDSPLIKIELSASSKLDEMEAEWKYLVSILGAPQSGSDSGGIPLAEISWEEL